MKHFKRLICQLPTVNCQLIISFVVLFSRCNSPQANSVSMQRVRASIPEIIVAAEQLNDCQKSRIELQKLLSQVEKQLPETDTALANVYYALAHTCLDACKSYDDAVMYGQKALDIRRIQLGNAHILTARAGNLVAKSMIAKSEILNALHLYQSIDDFQNPLNAQDSADLADIYGSRARIYNYLGDSAQTNIFSKKALNLFTKVGFPENRGFYFNTLAQSEGSNLSVAIQNFQNALKAFEYADSVDPSNKQYWQNGKPSIWHNWGILERKFGHFNASKDLFNKALLSFEQQQDTINAAETRIELAKLFIEEKDWKNAEVYARQSLRNRQLLLPAQHPDIVEAWNVLGIIHSAQKKMPIAQRDFDNACAAIGNYRALEIVEPLMLRAILKTEDSFKDALQSDIAFTDCIIADSILAETRQIFQSESAKVEFSKYTADFYENAIALATRLSKTRNNPIYLEAAARFISRNKSQNWLDKMRDQRARLFGGINPNDLQQEQNLRREWAFLEKSRAEATDSMQKVSFSDKIFKLRIEIDALDRAFQLKCPQYSNLLNNQTSTNFNSVAQTQKKLTDSTIAIEFYLGKKNVFALCFDKSKAQIFQTTLNAKLQNAVKNLRRTLSDEAFLVDSTLKAEQLFKISSYQVYSDLLEQPLISFKTAKRLRIVPDGHLGYIPYDVLLDKPSENADWQTPSSMSYLVQKYAISEVFSLQQIGMDSKEVINPSLCGFGSEYAEEPINDTPTDIENTFRSDKMGRLRYAVVETRHALSLLKKGQVWVNKDALKSTFLENASKFDVLHLALHGFSDDKQPLNSGLVFSKNPKDTALNSEILRGYDIYGSNLHTKLAVLSACHTGDGILQFGQGVMSLARIFAEAGCRSEIMSLWSIPDKTTSEIITAFYTNWQEGEAKDIAMQKAKKNYLLKSSPQFAIPNYWAATVVMGDLAPIRKSIWFWQSDRN